MIQDFLRVSIEEWIEIILDSPKFNWFKSTIPCICAGLCTLQVQIYFRRTSISIDIICINATELSMKSFYFKYHFCYDWQWKNKQIVEMLDQLRSKTVHGVCVPLCYWFQTNNTFSGGCRFVLSFFFQHFLIINVFFNHNCKQSIAFHLNVLFI